MDTASLLSVICQAVPGASIEERSSIDMPTISLDRDHVLEVFTTLRDHPQLQFSFLCDVTAVDRLPADPRFEVVYHLACLGEAYARGTAAAPARLRVKVGLPGADPRVASVTSIYPAANWPEREIFDLFAIVFEGHPDLRRILMPDDWEGAPLRKDYPVQIRKTPQGWSPVQLTVEEFAENIRAQHAAAEARAGRAPRTSRE